MEFSKEFGKEAELLFWGKLNDLAYDIHDTLKAMEPQMGSPAKKAEGSAVQQMVPATGPIPSIQRLRMSFTRSGSFSSPGSYRRNSMKPKLSRCCCAMT